MAIVAVSAHLDDAALSASASLSGAGATVVTVFSGLPPDGHVSLWDRVTGAASSADRIVERLAEDAQALRILSARGRYLGEREVQYREASGEPDPDLGALAGRMAEYLAAADEVWLPAAIGRHPDHVITRDAGLRAVAATGHDEVVLYADFPYVISYGWPAWVTGEPADPYLESEPWLDFHLAAMGFAVPARTAEVIRLSPAQRQDKAAVCAAYRSQAAALGLTSGHLAREPAKLDYELFWRLPLDATAR
jgi:LmbE family N-acetylglucosaminyl deacetylase